MTERVIRPAVGDDTPRARLLYGVDAVSGLRMLPQGSVHCVVTSPPYYGLRDYGTEPVVWTDGWVGELGQEPTPDLFVSHLVLLFREVRRVLRPDGTLWLNLGDTYVRDNPVRWDDSSHVANGWKVGQATRMAPVATPDGPPPKNLLGIPWRVALALQADGWYLRGDVIWNRPNAMPESVRDRPSKCHEYVFLLTPSETYYYDVEATRRNGTNLRSVWNIPTKPYRGAHFAVFPPDLPRTCIQAGSSERGCCHGCGAPWARVTARPCPGCGGPVRTYATSCPACGHVRDWKEGREIHLEYGEVDWDTSGRGVPRLPGSFVSETVVLGWEPTCTCEDPTPVPCTILDPFSGSATTGEAALTLGRAYVGLDANDGYLDLAEARLSGQRPPRPDPSDTDEEGSVLDLFGG